MTKRTFISKSGDQYEWEETPEVLAALAAITSTKTSGAATASSPILTNQLLGITLLCIWSPVIL
jgi:hypothetical protein